MLQQHDLEDVKNLEKKCQSLTQDLHKVQTTQAKLIV